MNSDNIEVKKTNDDNLVTWQKKEIVKEIKKEIKEVSNQVNQITGDLYNVGVKISSIRILIDRL